MGKSLHSAWQVFGLVDILTQKPSDRRFPILILDQCSITAFVSTYRCGTVPDLHRVPSCRTLSGHTKRSGPYIVYLDFVNTKYRHIFFPYPTLLIY